MALNFQNSPSAVKLKKSTIQGTDGHTQEIASAAKHTTAKTHFHSSDRQDTTDIVADPKIADVTTKTKDEIKEENTKTRLGQTTRQLDLKEREILLKEDAAKPKKTGPSMEQQLADRKLSDLQTKQQRLGEKGSVKGWSEKKLARKEKRLGKKVEKAEKMTDPLHRYEKGLERQRAADIFASLSSGQVETSRADAFKKNFEAGQIGQDVETSKKAGQEIPATKPLVDPNRYENVAEDKELEENVMDKQLITVSK